MNIRKLVEEQTINLALVCDKNKKGITWSDITLGR